MVAHTEMKPQFSSPQQIADLGEKIYRERLKADLEHTSSGKFVAIDVATGNHFIADNPEDAIGEASSHNHGGIFHLIRIGFSGAFQIGYAHKQSGPDWLSRP
jgi:hypothetical protein